MDAISCVGTVFTRSVGVPGKRYPSRRAGGRAASRAEDGAGAGVAMFLSRVSVLRLLESEIASPNRNGSSSLRGRLKERSVGSAVNDRPDAFFWVTS